MKKIVSIGMVMMLCTYFLYADITSKVFPLSKSKFAVLGDDGKENPDAAWYYPQPKEAAKQIKDHVAFWKGVDVTDS